MVGMIITGHGIFAEGVTSSLNIIAGEQKNYIALNFDGLDVEGYTESFKKALDELSMMDHIVVMCDIAGGTPFKTAVILTENDQRVRVVGGANVPLICEIALSRDYATDFEEFFNESYENSKETIMVF